MPVKLFRRRIKRASDLRGEANQLDLFCDERSLTTLRIPAWPELPAEIQITLVGLMSKLILEHADKSGTASRAEAGHDL